MSISFNKAVINLEFDSSPTNRIVFIFSFGSLFCSKYLLKCLFVLLIVMFRKSLVIFLSQAVFSRLIKSSKASVFLMIFDSFFSRYFENFSRNNAFGFDASLKKSFWGLFKEYSESQLTRLSSCEKSRFFLRIFLKSMSWLLKMVSKKPPKMWWFLIWVISFW